MLLDAGARTAPGHFQHLARMCAYGPLAAQHSFPSVLWTVLSLPGGWLEPFAQAEVPDNQRAGEDGVYHTHLCKEEDDLTLWKIKSTHSSRSRCCF